MRDGERERERERESWYLALAAVQPQSLKACDASR